MSLAHKFVFPFSDCDAWQARIESTYGDHATIRLAHHKSAPIDFKVDSLATHAQRAAPSLGPATCGVLGPDATITVFLTGVDNAAVFYDMMPHDFDVERAAIIKTQTPLMVNLFIGSTARDSGSSHAHHSMLSSRIPKIWFPLIARTLHKSIGLASVYSLHMHDMEIMYLGLANATRELVILATSAESTETWSIPTAQGGSSVTHLIPIFDMDDGFAVGLPSDLPTAGRTAIAGIPQPTLESNELSVSMRRWKGRGRPADIPILYLHGALESLRPAPNKRPATDDAGDDERPTKKQMKEWLRASFSPWQTKLSLRIYKAEKDTATK